MLVGRSCFSEVLQLLQKEDRLSLDTETSGLRPYHGDRLFSVIIGSKSDTYYFNFQPYPSLESDKVLTSEHLKQLGLLFSDTSKIWYIHKFNYDLHILAQDGLEIAGEVHCTLTQGRVEYNDHMEYDLDASLDRIGLKKDDKVKKWIVDNNQWDWESIPGKKNRKKNLHYDKAPFDLIVPYGEDDARGTFALGDHQVKSLTDQSKIYPKGWNTCLDIMHLERRLAKTVYRMERVGVKIDRKYCERAIKYEEDRRQKAEANFKRETNRDFKASPKLFSEVFESERALWTYTEKRNPSFDGDALDRLKSPAAAIVREIRDAKAKADFYHGFLYHADRDDVVHPGFSPGGTVTGRFSSSDPNLQNLTSEEDEDLKHEFVVRRAFIPRPGFIFIMPDWDSMEYRMMLDQAKEEQIKQFESRHYSWSNDFFEVANKVAKGMDIHEETAKLMGVTRKIAKTLNFMLLYGGGAQKLADALGITLDEAIKLKSKYFRVMPYVNTFIASVQDAVRKVGWISNWAGRKYAFKDIAYSYKGPNTIIQGGCADVAKHSMVNIGEALSGSRSRLLLTIHDELPCEIHESEISTVPKIVKEIMENVYPYKHVPLTASMEWSDKSLADKVKGFPV